MKAILEDAIEVLKLVSLDCQDARHGLGCSPATCLAMERNAEGVISKYEAEKRREDLAAIHARRSEPSLREVLRVFHWLEERGKE